MRRNLLLLALATCAIAGAAEPLRMDVQPLFEGQEITMGYMPLRITLENDGPPARGFVLVTRDGEKTAYPVDLPTGARKDIPAFLNLTWSGGSVMLRTDRGTLTKDVQTGGSYDSNVQTVLLISQGMGGGLAGLRALGKAAGSGLVHDAYVRPDAAPDRPLAYQGIAAVILGEGSERLTDDAVAALRNYALLGGTVVLLGGASAPVLSDPRWSDVAPVENGKVETVGTITMSDTDIEGPVSLVNATPRDGTIVRDRSNGIPTIVERPIGLGRALFMAVNPLESNVTGEEMAQLVYRSLRLTDGRRGRDVLNTFGNVGYPMPSGPIYAVGTPTPGSDARSDPFTAQLPSFETILWILGGFFVAVIPINFLVLKAFKKGEWAWFTAPLLSLGFAGLLFSKARDLYAAKSSTYSVGALVAQQGTPEGWFVGETNFFIPSGGVYDLKLKNVDAVGEAASASPDPFSYNPAQNQPELQSVDDGRVMTVPELRANNLAFRALQYRQEYDSAGGWFRIDAEGRRGEDFVRMVVRNVGPYPLRQGVVLLGENQLQIGQLGPGESKRVSGAFIKPNFNRNGRPPVPPGAPAYVDDGSDSSLGSFSYRTRRPVLTGFLGGLRPGPEIGTDLQERSSIRLLFMGDVR